MSELARVSFRSKHLWQLSFAGDEVNFIRHSPAERHVLIVEDNELNRRLFSTLLEAYGYICHSCSTFEQGLDVMRERCEEIYLVILDIQLPDDSGLHWFSRASVCTKFPVGVMVVTAFALKADKARVMEFAKDSAESNMPFVGYMAKPIQMKPFVDEVLHFMDRIHALRLDLLSAADRVNANLVTQQNEQVRLSIGALDRSIADRLRDLEESLDRERERRKPKPYLQRALDGLIFDLVKFAMLALIVLAAFAAYVGGDFSKALRLFLP